jgi:hypothetical protein
MNCARIQQTLLASERPDQPSAALQQHLAGCSACQAWHQRLVAAERDIPLLPVPSSAGRARFLQQLHDGESPVVLEPDRPAPRSIWLEPHRPMAKERGLRKMAVAFSLAAALALFALGFWAWPRGDQPVVQPNPNAAELKERRNLRDQRLTTAQTSRERVEILADIAAKLHRELLGLARSVDGERLAMLAKFYGEVVRDGLLFHAGQLPARERPALEAVARLLNDTESELLRMLASDGAVTPAAAAPLREVAQSARFGHDQLRTLLSEKTA